MPKYEYLTKKDLNYKPNAFEQAKFEYSPLGKVFIDGLDKSDRKKGLSKKLKNIEDKIINQLLALKDINRPAIRGRNGDDDDDDDDDDEYKKIQNFKKELIDKNILHKDGSKKFGNIINKWKETKDNNIVYINTKSKVYTRKFDIYDVFYGYLSKDVSYEKIKEIINNIKRAIKLYQENRSKLSDINKSIIYNSNKTIKGMELIISLIDNDEFRIPGEYYAKPLNNTDLSWIKDEEGYKETAEEEGSDYMKGKNDNELKLIKYFITKINNGTINKNKAGNEFRKLKQKVTNDILRQDLIRNSEKYLFGEDNESSEPYRFKYDLIDKLDLRNPNKNIALANLCIYYTWKNVRSIYKSSKFKISAPTWNETFDLPDGSYNISEIQDYFEYIIKKHETFAETAPKLIYANNITNRIVFKIKTGYKLELL